jgi:NlpA lipoprotein
MSIPFNPQHLAHPVEALSSVANTIGSALLTGLLAAISLIPSEAGDGALRIGVNRGPAADLLRQAARKARYQGLDVQVVEFEHWAHLSDALAAKDIDLRILQHEEAPSTGQPSPKITLQWTLRPEDKDDERVAAFMAIWDVVEAPRAGIACARSGFSVANG